MRTKNKFTLLTSCEEKNTTDEVYAPLAVAVQKMSPRSSPLRAYFVRLKGGVREIELRRSYDFF